MIEKNIVDRVPTYPGRYKLTPVEGQPDIFDFERADEPTVEGTPLDKSTFDSIIQSRLTGRFYMLNFDRIYGGESSNLNTNPIPSSGWTDYGFSQSVNGNYKATVNEGYGNYPSYAFDGNNDTAWVGAQNMLEHWLSLELPEAITAKKISLKVQVETPSNTPTIIIEGSNNNATWNALLTIRETQTAAKEYALTTTGAYKYYRVRITYTAANSPHIYTFGITQYVVNQYSNSYIIESGVPVEWTNGQRITVQTPTNANTFSVISNTLNGVNINTILQPNRRYELIYNGATFEAKGV